MKLLLALAMSSGFTLPCQAHSVCDVCKDFARNAYHHNITPYNMPIEYYQDLYDATEEERRWFEAGRYCMLLQIERDCY